MPRTRVIFRTRARFGLGAVLVLFLALLAPGVADAAVPVHAATAVPHLAAGQRLVAGQHVYAPGRRVYLVMQGDGNLVLYGPSGALWSSGTYGHGGASAVMQTDGNLVVYGGSRALWSSRTNGSGGVRAAVSDDGHLRVVKASGAVVWSVPVPPPYLAAGQRLVAGQYVYAPGRRVYLVMQGDGNLVLYGPSGALWSSGTYGHGGASAVMQTDGNLVVYGGSRALWSSRTNGSGGVRAAVSDDGHLRVVKASGEAVWSVPAPTGAQLAALLLGRWGGRLSGLPGVQYDLQVAAAGRQINNGDSCNRPVTLDPRLLQLLVSMTDRYQVRLNNIVTGHGCDGGMHPRGKAVDVNVVIDPATGRSTNFHSWGAGDNVGLDHDFAQFLATRLAPSGGLGQAQCPGRTGLALPAGVLLFSDYCNHQHADTR